MTLTKVENSIFLGNLLGDGHVQKRGNSYRTKIAHSIVQQDYVMWKYEKLKDHTQQNHPPKIVQSKHGYKTCFFYLDSGSYLGYYHDLFYEPYSWVSKTEHLKLKEEKVRYRKTISTKLLDELPEDPLILAVWYMDDGSLRNGASGSLATQCFAKEELFLLQKYVAMFEIKTQIVLHSRKKNQYTLTIPAKNNNFKKFCCLIEPYINEVPCMKYKLL